MKKRNKIISLVMAMILMCLITVGVNANNIMAIDAYENEFEVNENTFEEDELMPRGSVECYMSEAEALDYAISFLGPNAYVDEESGHQRANTDNGFKQVRLDLSASKPHINCETFVLQSNGRYKCTRNEHIYIV